MAKVKLTYFDMAASRGEEVRLALNIAGVAFDDNRIDRETFAAMRSELPFPSLPVFEIEGKGVFGQTNAILRLIGRHHDLYPEDAFEAARHDALMDAVEDLRGRIGVTMRMQDEAAKKAARQQLSSDVIPHWGRCVERLIDGPFVGGDKPSVADIKLYMMHHWIGGGVIEHIPADLFADCPKFAGVAAAIRNHPVVVAWYNKS